MKLLPKIAFGLALTILTSVSHAHDGVVHKDITEALQHQEQTSPNTLGFPDVKGGDFTLTDHNGNTRTSKSPDGHYQLIFFGYANCRAICGVALPTMAAAVDLLKKEGKTVTPLLITVDPDRDTVDNMKEAIKHHHKSMIGLTGSEEELQVAYDAFSIEKSLVYEHPEYGPIYAHGSFIYLIDGEGNFKTLFPPILSSERISEVTKTYIEGKNS